MYSSEIKARQSQAVIKIAINSKKPLNNLKASQTTHTNFKDMENQYTINPRNMSKSKFTVAKSSKLSKQSSAHVPLFSQVTSVTKRSNSKTDTGRKTNGHVTSVRKTLPTNKTERVTQTTLYKRPGGRRNPSPVSENIRTQQRETTEMSIQTNECEILNPLLIVGDVRIVTPTQTVTDEIDKLKHEATQKLLLATRKFEEHSQRDEKHLDNLREFLDKSFVTRKSTNTFPKDNSLEQDRQLIESMDMLLQRERPKTESITDIRSRIKQKEQELLSLFDRFQK